MQDSNGVEIKITKEYLQHMTQESKLHLLIEVAVANNTSIAEIKDLLTKPGGICTTVGEHSKGLKFLWGLFVSAVTGVAVALLGLYGYLLSHISKGG